MAREIDWSKPLSDEDRKWALEWDQHEQVAQNDRDFGRVDNTASQDRADRISELRTVIAESTNELARLEQEQIAEDNANRAVAGDPATGNVIQDNTGVDGQTPEGAPEEPKKYDGWNVDKLKAEIKERNKEREEAELAPLSLSGSKAELTERLLADDREIAESQQP